MSNQQLVHLPSSDGEGAKKSFNSSDWRDYFEENRKSRPAIRVPNEIVLDETLRQPLLKSLQTFQIGESGDGRHLRKYAKKLGDPVYMQCMDMFIKEEQNHSQMLAAVILALNGTLINWHWSDLVFIGLRRLFHLKTELFILMIAEVIGKVFYQYVSERVDNEPMQEVFSLIVLDEILHIEFHTEFLAEQLRNYPWMAKFAAHYIWCVIFYTACFAFVLDHKTTLAALKISSGEFIETSSRIFHRAAIRSLSLTLV